jgi:hypothetical protein
MHMFRIVVAFTFVLVATSAAAQTPFGKPDDRFKGYPKSLVPKFATPPTPAELTACAANKYYEPIDTHLIKYVERIKHTIRVQKTDECTGMRTAAGDKLVLRPKGTKVAVDELGRDLFDMGSPTGKVCGNGRLFSIPVNVPVTTTPPAVIEVPPPAVRAPRQAPVTPEVPEVPRRVVPRQPAPPPTTTVISPNRPKPTYDGFGLSVGVKTVVGKVKSTYADPIPNSGDVPQRHNFRSVVAFAKIEPEDSGLFGLVEASVAGSAPGQEFQDITGSWITKRRASQSNQDKMYRALVGYGFSVESLTVSGYGGYKSLCFCENYTEGVATKTRRTYQGPVIGAEASGNAGRLNIAVGAEVGVGNKRKSWTEQTGFPRVDHATTSVTSLGLRIEGSVRVISFVHAFAGVEHLGINSTRPDTFAASERTGIKSVNFGVRLWGR